MKSIPKYLLSENPQALPHTVLVVSTASPYWVGHVWKFKSHDEYTAFIAQREPKAVGKILGYSIAVIFVGALGEYRLPTTQPEANALARVFRKMADCYYENRIESNRGRYKRYEERY